MKNYKHTMKNGDIIIWNDNIEEAIWFDSDVNIRAEVFIPDSYTGPMQAFLPFLLYDVEDYDDMADIAMFLSLDEEEAESLFDRFEEHMGDIEDFLSFAEDEGFIDGFQTDINDFDIKEILIEMLIDGTKE
jgi:hypothetical protein